MARARNIKPGLYKNEDLAECSIWARFIFPGLWMLADREGRLEDRPKRIKGELLPFDMQDAEPLLRELATRGFILRYQNSDGSFIQILKFKEHQTPHYSEKPSVIKPHDFQETPRHDDLANPGGDASLRGGRNPLTADSLNPSSLNPEKEKRSQAIATIPGVEDSLLADWLEVRRAKRAGKLTATAIKGLQREAMKAGLTLAEAITVCCECGWQGFNAQWYADRQAKLKPTYTPPSLPVTVPSKTGVDPALAKAIADSLNCKGPPPDIRSRMKQLSGARA